MTMTESNLWSLAQATRAGLFVSIEAARKAAQRDPRFPEPVAKKGSAFLYDAAALEDYRKAGRGRRPDLPEIMPHAGPVPEPVEGPEWKPVPGAGYYEASHRGHIRSVNRTIDGRFYEGRVLKLRADADGYLRVNITNDQRERQHNMSVARLVLMAHDPEGYAPGLESCHGPGGKLDNRWPENLRWDTREANWKEALEVRLANNPPKPPKEPQRCVNYEQCGNLAGRGGRRCHPCVVEVGRGGAVLLAQGTDLEEAAEVLGYASAVGLWRLAFKYGGARIVVGHAESQAPRGRRLRSVLFKREASRQNSDGA